MGVMERKGRAMTALTAIALVGTAMVAGVFFAFSTFVMQGLGRLPDREAAAAMQSINVTAVRPLFMTLLFGTAAVVVVAVIMGVRNAGWSPSRWMIVGAVLYLGGVVLVTGGANVPLNDKLAAMDPTAAATYWPDFLRDWLRDNHVRTLTSAASAVAWTIALLRLP